MMNLVDRYLLFRIRTKRDPEAFGRIYDRHVKALYRFCYLKLPSKEEAQDVTAETFTKAWNYLLRQQDVTHLRALLYRIARNLIADYYRNSPQATGIEIVSVTHSSESTSYLVGADSENEDETVGDRISDRGRGKVSLEHRAELALVIRDLDRLKEDYRDVVMLRLVDGLAFADIGKILGKQSVHVRVIYHRAIKTLKEFGV